MEDKKKIAVIGAGVSGIVASYLLQDKYQISLFEKNSYLGGHTNTFIVSEGEDSGLAVDTGFIVLNDKTYPNLHKFFELLDVPVRYSDMSFGFSCEKTGLQYSGRGLKGLFAQPLNLFRPRYLKFLTQIKNFCKVAAIDLDSGRLTTEITMKDYLKSYNFDNDLIYNYVVPMGAAIWSAPVNTILDFPAVSFLNFFRNHGLLSLKDRPKWQTVVGGSNQYVRKFSDKFNGQIFLNAEIDSIYRDDQKCKIRFSDGTAKIFDILIVATHADQAFQLIKDKTEIETNLLGVWKYQLNHTILHTDKDFLKIKSAAEASWNYVRENSGGNTDPLSVTYDMNRLQGIKSKKRYFVTLNSIKAIKEKEILFKIDYEHPVFDTASINSQKKLAAINGNNNTWFCGSYFKYGFHEDAATSAINVAKSLGADWSET